MIRWIFAALIDWAIIILCMITVYRWPLSFPLMVFIIGNRQHALGVLAHDSAHASVTKLRWLNDLLGQVICWWPLGVGIDSYRWFHLTHHMAISRGKPEQDPEVTHRAKFPKVYGVQITHWHKAKMFVLDLLGITSIPEAIRLAGTLIFNASMRDIIGLALVWGMADILLMHWHLMFIGFVWVFSLYTSNWAIHRFRTWGEHIGTNGTLDTPVHWWGNFLHTPHGIGYHTEHHKFARRPYYLLGKGL